MRRYLIVAVVTLLVLGGSVAIAQVDDGEVIHACAKTNNGQLRIVEGPEDCLTSEYAVSWNQVGPMGPEGPKGDKGDQGEQGEPGGMPDYYTVTDSEWLEPGVRANANAVCDEGDQVVNGGYWVGGDVEVMASYPVAEKGSPWDAWRVVGQNGGTVGTNFQAHALCADMTPDPIAIP